MTDVIVFDHMNHLIPKGLKTPLRSIFAAKIWTQRSCVGIKSFLGKAAEKGEDLRRKLVIGMEYI